MFLCLVLSGQQVEDLGLSTEQMEDKLLSLVNQERNSRGLPELGFDPLLRAMARAHSQKMMGENKLAHDFPGYEQIDKRAARTGLYFSKIGENVARSDTFVMRFFHEALLTSPEHRENILDKDFTHLGVGIEKSGVPSVRGGTAPSVRGGTATYYVTQEFAGLFEPLSQLEVEREMEKKLAIRFRGSIDLPESTAAEIKTFCRQMSLLFLQRQPPLPIPASYGAAIVLTLNFTEMEDGLIKILTKLQGIMPHFWSLGVTFGRSAANPGGAYALTIIAIQEDTQQEK